MLANHVGTGRRGLHAQAKRDRKNTHSFHLFVRWEGLVSILEVMAPSPGYVPRLSASRLTGQQSQ